MSHIPQSFYYKLVDLYPNSLKPTIKQVKKQIDHKIHSYMTGYRDKIDLKILQDHHFQLISEKNSVKVFRLSENHSWIVKTQRPNAFKECSGEQNKQGWAVFDLRGCFMKQIVLSWKMRKIINDQAFDKLNVTKKYLCSYPKKIFKPENEQSMNYFLFEEHVQVDRLDERVTALNHKTAEEIQIISKQLCALVKKGGYSGLHLDNLAVGDRITLLDIEPKKLYGMAQICVSSRLKRARIGLQNFFDSLNQYAEQNPGEYQAFKIFQQDCVKTIEEIKKEEKKRLVILVLKTLSCVSLIPIPIYLTLYLMKRAYSRKQIRQTLIAALQED